MIEDGKRMGTYHEIPYAYAEKLKKLLNGEQVMKQLLLAVLILLVSVSAYAWDIDAQYFRSIAQDEEGVVQNGDGYQITLSGKWLYFYGTYETAPLRFAGQRGIDLNIASVGLGAQYDLLARDESITRFLIREGIEVKQSKNSFKIMFDVGYYHPMEGNGNGDTQVFNESTHAEGIWRHMHQRVAVERHYIDKKEHMYFSSLYTGEPGARLGAQYEHQFTNRFSVGIGVRYRYLNLHENLKSWDGVRGQNGGWWETIGKRNFSTVQVPVMAKFSFQKRARRVIRNGKAVYIR